MPTVNSVTYYNVKGKIVKLESCLSNWVQNIPLDGFEAGVFWAVATTVVTSYLQSLLQVVEG